MGERSGAWAASSSWLAACRLRGRLGAECRDDESTARSTPRSDDARTTAHSTGDAQQRDVLDVLDFLSPRTREPVTIDVKVLKVRTIGFIKH